MQTMNNACPSHCSYQKDNSCQALWCNLENNPHNKPAFKDVIPCGKCQRIETNYGIALRDGKHNLFFAGDSLKFRCMAIALKDGVTQQRCQSYKTAQEGKND